ncbi:MAG: DNA repair protein [Bacteroidetes bacterium GWF2_40_14]|nr:MAG: DNA repair protein [Bacteroidetes bacterium GWF2_40_14]
MDATTQNSLFKACEVSLSYITKVKASERYKIESSAMAYKLLIDNFFDCTTIEHKESFKIILLNQANKVLGVSSIAEGGISATVADLRLIMQVAILANASSIIIAHNHPSGNTKPSANDDKITEDIKKACGFMQINLLDHLIVTPEQYFSYADEGRI